MGYSVPKKIMTKKLALQRMEELEDYFYHNDGTNILYDNYRFKQWLENVVNDRQLRICYMNQISKCKDHNVCMKFTLGDLLKRYKFAFQLLIRDEKQQDIAIVMYPGKGVEPYVNMEVVSWYIGNGDRYNMVVELRMG